MGKYTHMLDMDGDNSAAQILRQVAPNTTVLEFGPASGYMTEYMKETLNCDVHIVEINEEDGKEASQFAKSALIGPVDGDIEDYNWTGIEPCDYIIFADVLEHLYNPWQVLEAATALLKEGGSILISIPNISHNSVIIDLINGKFNYRELGLLDSTHIRFFTRESLLYMVQYAGLRVEKEMNTFCAVEHTEFKNNLTDVPEEVSKALQERPDGILYQFVWELKK